MSNTSINLNPVQKEAITYGEGPMLVLAGAGSGKTSVLTQRIVWLVDKGVKADSILAITFTNKAATEMKDRVTRLIEATSNNLPQMGTFHATCVRILRNHSHHIGIPNNFSIYDETDSNALVKQVMQQNNIPIKQINPRAVKATISRAKNEMVNSADFTKYARGFFQENVARIYPQYQSLLKQNQALDFDDLLLKTLDLLSENPTVCEYWNSRIEYLLIDEYQDTNKIQYQLSRILSSRTNNINVVGDAAQSIYAFRGADLRNINQFIEDYPTVKVFNLEQNYRSTQSILDAATEVIRPNERAHPVLNLWTNNNKGEKITIFEGGTGSSESMFIAKTIVSYINRGEREYSDFAVLYRANVQSRQIEEDFIKYGVPYRIVGGVRFYDRREVKDLISYLRLISNIKDSVSFDRIVNVPPRGIGKVTQKQGGVKLDNFHMMLERLRASVDKLVVAELLGEVIETTGYKSYILDGTEEGQLRWDNVQELLNVAAEYSVLSPKESLESFLQSVSLLEQTDTVKENNKVSIGSNQGQIDDGNRVSLMTVHAAKGLEFPIVFLVGMEEGTFPHLRSMEDEFDIQEERRLCYVGITRAMQKLFLTYVRVRSHYGSYMPGMPSRFLRDLKTDNIEYVSDGLNPTMINNEYEDDPLNPWDY